MKGLVKLLLILITFFIFKNEIVLSESEDYYKLLGVSRDATVKEIRKAFKVLAVKLHPDKNKDDKYADARFIKLTRAYEVLKDPETRKFYDVHGDEKDPSSFRKQYHSYTYYRDQFGIYDDDPLIITLSKNDYEVNILDNNQAWFVNFYSPMCHHCHELAPTWRQLARELEGVIRIGAVNCEDDLSLCHQLRIEAYPTLLYYEKESHLFEGQKYYGDRNVKALKAFVLSKIHVNIEKIASDNWDDLNGKQWLLFLCAEGDDCPEKETMIKSAASLEGLMLVGLVEDSRLQEDLRKEHKDKRIIFWQIRDGSAPAAAIHYIDGSDTKEILEQILGILPNPEVLDEEKFKTIRTSLRSEIEKPWLICFYMGAATELNLQLKRLPPMIPDVNIGLIHCGKSSALCSSLHVQRYPSWGVLKVGGAFELHHGRDVLYEIVSFAKDSIKSTNLHALSPADFLNIKQEGSTWFIDWYAPWCPPCRKLLPELRRASQQFNEDQVQFGTIDCTLHRDLCIKNNIMSYPTTILYNKSQIHHFHGMRDANGITEFIQDMIHPLVTNLDEDSFIKLTRKPTDELWIVDFFAPWCGPCQRLAPEWRQLAKQVSQFPQVKVAEVDCVANSDLCDTQNVRSYPTIRLYPLGSKGLSSLAIYNGNRDAVSLKRWILSFLPSPVEQLTSKQFEDKILNKDYKLPWLVDFYAPWCGHCIHFEPEFRTIAQKMEKKVKCAKIDCETERIFCGRQGVTGYPTIRLYLSSSNFYVIDSQDPNYIIERVNEIIAKNLHKRKRDEL